MSTQYQSSRDVPTEVLAARLNELADVVAQKRDRIGAEFTMRIPAECDRDADLVMSEAARRLSAAPDTALAQERIKALESQRNDLLAALEAFCEVGGKDFDGWATAYDDAVEMARAAIKKARGES